MQIDENTQGSLANQEAVRLLTVWMSVLFIADCLVCVMCGGYHGLSGLAIFSAPVKSLVFSYGLGILLIIVAVRYFGRVIGVRRVYPVGMLRYFVILGALSVVMGLALVLSDAPAKPIEDTSELLNSETERWQAVRDAKAFCAKEGKEVILQKLDRRSDTATFICR